MRAASSMVSLADSAASGGAKMLAGQAVRLVINIAGVVVLSRMLAPADFGLVAMVAAVANLAIVVGDFGLSAAAIQSQGITHQQRSNLFWTNALLGLLLSAVVALLGVPLAKFYGESEIVGIAQAISVTFLLSALAAQFRAELSRNLKFGQLAVIDMVAPFTALIAAIGAALAGFGYWALVVQPVGMALVTLVLAAALSRWRPSRPRRASMRDLYGFGAGSLGIQIATYISTNIDDVLVGKFSGPAAAGVYSRAYQLFRIPMQQVAVPIARVGLPILSRIQDDAKRFEAFVLRGQLVLAYAFGGIFYFSAAAADPIIDIALGSGWEDAKLIFLALSIGGVFQSLTTGYWWVFQAKGLVVYLLKFSIASRTVMVGLLFVGLPWGPLGVACASATGQAVIWITYTLLAIPRTGVSRRRLVAQAVTPVLCGTSAMAAGLGVSVAVDGVPPIAQLAAVTVTFALTVFVLRLLVPSLRRDLDVLWATVRRGIPKK